MLSEVPLRPTWAEIDLTAIAHNVWEFRRIISPGTKLMAVVKADGYGHGAVEVAREAVAAGVSFLGVAMVEEALELRRHGITEPILVLGFTAREYADILCEYNLTPAVFTLPEAEAFSAAAIRFRKKLPVHVKIDTGMGRIGCFPAEASDDFIRKVAAYPGLELEGLFTHFAAADNDPDYTRWQLKQFTDLVERMACLGIHIPVKHAANSAAAVFFPETHLDMVRLGIGLYGLEPSADRGKSSLLQLQPAMALKSRFIFLKEVPAGTRVSYGCTFTAENACLLGTLTIGYGDGYSRGLSNRGRVLVRGLRAPVVGRICMDHTVINVQGIPGVCQGDEAVLFGRQGDAILPVDEVAGWLDTIHYEVVTAVSRRVPRVYLRQGRVDSVRGM